MPLDRRQFLALAAAGASLSLLGERARAQATVSAPPDPAQAVWLNFNENPLGPPAAAREAAQRALAGAGRYRFELQQTVAAAFAEREGLPADHAYVYAGSTEPLQYAVLAFCGPGRGLVTVSPGFEAPEQCAQAIGAPVTRVPLRADGAHDVDALLAADPRAGVIYVCNPNNPTGSITPRADLERLLARKPPGTLLLVDEAYIHYSEQRSLIDRVAAGEDLIVLRTFSKLYGMAGLRCGVAAARPSLLARLQPYGGENAISVVAAEAALAALADPRVVPERKAAMRTIREDIRRFLLAAGHAVTPSESCCLMFEVDGEGRAFTAAMAAQGVVIGRSWPAWPRWVRLSLGSEAEMARFREAFRQVRGAAPRLHGSAAAAAMTAS